MNVKLVKVRSILSKSKVYDYVINPYIGCQHGCVYCYARVVKRFTGHREPWGEFVDVKINASLLLREDLRKKKKGGIWISGLCDPYQPLEEEFMITRKCLEILSDCSWPVFIQTKSPMVLRDLDVIKKFSFIEVGFSIGTAFDEISRIFEPNAPSIDSRIEALSVLKAHGVKTYAMIAPVLPGAEGLIERLSGKVNYVIVDKMNYHYADWVFKKYGFEKTRDVSFLVFKFQKSGIRAYFAS
ncbi:MAG: radical SAM protein [candidate division WOR-3 bacterium]